jgi:hypothetical protein
LLGAHLNERCASSDPTRSKTAPMIRALVGALLNREVADTGS